MRAIPTRGVELMGELEGKIAEAALSSAETALETQRIGGLQIRVAMLCTVVPIRDGYDMGSIGWAVPPLTHVWHLPDIGVQELGGFHVRRHQLVPDETAVRIAHVCVSIRAGKEVAAPFGQTQLIFPRTVENESPLA